MNRLATLLGVGVLLVASLAAPALGVAPTGLAAPAQQASQSNASASPPSPGAQLSAAVEVHEAEVDGEIEGRAFGIAIATAASNDSRAAVVGERTRTLQDRLAELRDRKRAIVEANQDGNLSDAHYRTAISGLGARIAVLRSQTNATEAAAEGLPRALLEEQGVNVSALETLRRNASDLAGPEVAAIARTVGGPGLGAGLGAPVRGPPGAVLPTNRGPPGSISDPNGTLVGPPTSRPDGGGPPADGNGSAGDGPPADGEAGVTDR